VKFSKKLKIYKKFSYLQKKIKRQACLEKTVFWGQCYKTFYDPTLELEFLLGQAQASPSNIRLGWKGLPGTNALAYYEKA
jgi:hypothetical protein